MRLLSRTLVWHWQSLWEPGQLNAQFQNTSLALIANPKHETSVIYPNWAHHEKIQIQI